MVSSKSAKSPGRRSARASAPPPAPRRTKPAPPAPARKAASKTAAAGKSARVAPRGAPMPRLVAGENRLLRAVEGISLQNTAALNAVVKRVPHKAVELAPTFHQVFQRNRSGAARLAQAYATSISDPLHHRELFQQAVEHGAGRAPHADRRLPPAGQARGVVHAIGQLPRAQGGADARPGAQPRTTRRSTTAALRDVLLLAARRRRRDRRACSKAGRRQPPDEPTTRWSTSSRTSPTTSPTRSTRWSMPSSTPSSRSARRWPTVVNWAANDVANLVKALSSRRGKTVLDLAAGGARNRLRAGQEDRRRPRRDRHRTLQRARRRVQPGQGRADHRAQGDRQPRPPARRAAAYLANKSFDDHQARRRGAAGHRQDHRQHPGSRRWSSACNLVRDVRQGLRSSSARRSPRSSRS